MLFHYRISVRSKLWRSLSGNQHTMPRLHSTCRRLLPPVVILAAAVWAVYPVIGQFGSSLPIRSSQLTTVPLFNAWTIWWNADRLTHGFQDYWQAPIFFPADSTFAYSEPQPATLAVAPVYWLTGSPAIAYNVYLLLSLCLNGLVAFVVLQNQGCHRIFATIGAVMMVWLPIGLDQIEVLQLVPVWPMLWMWDVLRRHGHRPGFRTALESAAAYTVCFYTCIHHTLFLSVVLTATGWSLLSAVRTKQFWGTSIFALGLAILLVGIVFWPIQQTLHGESFERSKDLVANLSAHPRDLFRLPTNAMLFGSTRPGFHLSAGWLKTALAATGVLIAVTRRRRRRWKLFLLLTIVCSGLLALGPHLKLGTWHPWWTLSEICPGMEQVRNVFRFAYLTQMAIILLAVSTLSELHVHFYAVTKKRWRVIWALALAGLLALAEIPCTKPLLTGVPDLERNHNWADFVKQNTPTGKAVACVPFSAGTRASDFDITTRWMYLGTLHGVPLVNGYSGFFPKHYMRLRQDITDNGLNDRLLAELRAMRVHFIVVRANFKLPGNLRRMHWVFWDPVGINVYKLSNEHEDAERLSGYRESGVVSAISAFIRTLIP